MSPKSLKRTVHAHSLSRTGRGSRYKGDKEQENPTKILLRTLCDGSQPLKTSGFLPSNLSLGRTYQVKRPSNQELDKIKPGTWVEMIISKIKSKLQKELTPKGELDYMIKEQLYQPTRKSLCGQLTNVCPSHPMQTWGTCKMNSQAQSGIEGHTTNVVYCNTHEQFVLTL